MRFIPILLLLISSVFTYGQSEEYLETADDKIVFTEFDNGIPSQMTEMFSNFESRKEVKDAGILEDGQYTVTNAQHSTITITQENIGRIVLYATLLTNKDTNNTENLAKREGKIVIKLYRQGHEPTEITKVFNEDFFQEIHENTRKAGVEKVEFIFKTKDYFVIKKLKVIPLNNAGVYFYKELEISEKSIEELTQNLSEEAEKTKKTYNTYLQKIDDYHKSLNDLIVGSKFMNVATIQGSSLNPFSSTNFTSQFNSIVSKASSADQEKLKGIQNGLTQNNISSLTSSLDNLITGGKFTSLINIVDGLFNSSMTFKNENGEESVFILGSNYYEQKKSGDNIKLILITDSEQRKKIDDVFSQRDAFKQYITSITNFMAEDLKTINEINKDIEVAKVLQTDFEILLWDMIDPLTTKDRSDVISDNEIKFLEVGQILANAFRLDSMDVNKFQSIREKAKIQIEEFDALYLKYTALVSKIKSNYDQMYDMRPTKRKNMFVPSSAISTEIVMDWKDNQDNIINEYRKTDGLQQLLSDITKD